jgi:hypothetical protein
VRESLRPWLESGLQFVYAPGGLTAQAQPEPVQAQTAPQSGPAQGRPDSARQGQGPQAARPSGQPAAQSQGRPASGQQLAPSSPARPAPGQASNFPEPWSTFLRYTKPGAKVVMTYMELGLDLGGQSDPRRRAVLKNLQAHLKWPPGTINFWPVAAMADGALQPDTSMFWRGWEQWRTPYIICFGEETLRVMLPDADMNNRTHFLENVIVYKLPSIARFIDMLPHEQQLAVDDIVNIRL